MFAVLPKLGTLRTCETCKKKKKKKNLGGVEKGVGGVFWGEKGGGGGGGGEVEADDGWKTREVDLLQRYPRQTEFTSFLAFPRGQLFLLPSVCCYKFF